MDTISSSYSTSVLHLLLLLFLNASPPGTHVRTGSQGLEATNSSIEQLLLQKCVSAIP